MLQIGVVTEGKALLMFAGGIEFDEVAGDVLDVLLGALLQTLPLTCAQCGHTRLLTILLRLVFRYLI